MEEPDAKNIVNRTTRCRTIDAVDFGGDSKKVSSCANSLKTQLTNRTSFRLERAKEEEELGHECDELIEVY